MPARCRDRLIKQLKAYRAVELRSEDFAQPGEDGLFLFWGGGGLALEFPVNGAHDARGEDVSPAVHHRVVFPAQAAVDLLTVLQHGKGDVSWPLKRFR